MTLFTNAIEESSRCKLYKVFEIKMCSYRSLIKLVTVLQNEQLSYSAHEFNGLLPYSVNPVTVLPR